jgi:hypothetical protein
MTSVFEVFNKEIWQSEAQTKATIQNMHQEMLDYKKHVGHFCAASENVYTNICEPGPIHHIQNETACNDGYNHGWIKECLKDGSVDCKARHIGGPVIAAITGPGHCYNTEKEGETCESGNFIPND